MANKIIYVVDDDSSILEILSIILKDNGYEVVVSSDGSSLQTLDIVPSLIILDIRLANIDGSQICRKCKESEKLSSVPVILVSANLDGKEIAQACGADDFLAKPFALKEILQLTEKYMVPQEQ
ncbi:MAG TPA: response regulator [Chitinophagaceae bacterium]